MKSAARPTLEELEDAKKRAVRMLMAIDGIVTET